MALMEYTLFGTHDLVEVAIERLRINTPKDGEMYWLAFSGGKDSAVVYELMKRSGMPFKAYYNVTRFDPPELVRHIARNYPDVTWLKPPETFLHALLRKRFPPMRTQRWCCEIMKEAHGEGLVVTGIRKAESRSRKERKSVEACYKRPGKWYVNPIIDWTAADVWEFIRGEGLPYCELYDQGWKRIGCLMCPCAGRQRREQDAKAYPRVAGRIIAAFDKLVQVRRDEGNPLLSWATGEELFWWWIREPPKAHDAKGQIFMFDQHGEG